MSILLFISILLANWRITHLFSKEEGPFDIIFRLRKAVGNCFWGKLLDGFYCTSIWVSLPFGMYAGNNWSGKLLFWIAFSGGACLLEQATTHSENKNELQLPIFKEEEPCATVVTKEPD